MKEDNLCIVSKVTIIRLIQVFLIDHIAYASFESVMVIHDAQRLGLSAVLIFCVLQPEWELSKVNKVDVIFCY